MSSPAIHHKTQKLTCPGLSLAVYREIAAHLRQVDGVNSDLFAQTATEFDYLQSQVGGLWLEYLPNDEREQQVNSILTYYELKYSSSWQSLES